MSWSNFKRRGLTRIGVDSVNDAITDAFLLLPIRDDKC
jgi:hypothetical protein